MLPFFQIGGNSMTINEAVSRIDDLMRNAYTTENKIAWLSRVDNMIKAHIIDKHEGNENVSFSGYSPNVDRSTELIANAPFDEMYPLFLEAQIHYYNGEYDKYNNAIVNFQMEYDKYAAWYTCHHTPLSKGRFLF